MPTIIDSLIVELGLDPTKFTQGQKQAAQSFLQTKDMATRAAKELEARGKQAANFFNAIKKEVVGLVGAYFGFHGLKEMLVDVVSSDAKVGRLAKTLGLSVESLGRWQAAARLAGGSAEGITGSMAGLSGEIQKFLLTGESSVIPYFRALGISLVDSSGKIKSVDELFLELADSFSKLDPARARAFGQALGFDQETINLLIKGRAAVQGYLDEAARIGVVSKESAEASNRLVRGWNEFTQAIDSAGRQVIVLGTRFADMMPKDQSYLDAFERVKERWLPGLLKIQGVMDDFLGFFRGFGGKLLDAVGEWPNPFAALDERVRRAWEGSTWRQIFGPTEPARPGATAPIAPAPGATAPIAPAPSIFRPPRRLNEGDLSDNERETYIREAARKRGIDPDVAVRVARSEGLGGRIGDRGSSFGDWQLHYGGVASGGNAVPGLGDEFTRKTGLDARDPSTWRQQTDFALDYAAGHGWGPWHGWHGLPDAGITPNAAAIGATAVAQPSIDNSVTSTTTHDVKVDRVIVNTQATDAEGIAKDMGSAIERHGFAAQANSGPG